MSFWSYYGFYLGFPLEIRRTKHPLRHRICSFKKGPNGYVGSLISKKKQKYKLQKSGLLGQVSIPFFVEKNTAFYLNRTDAHNCCASMKCFIQKIKQFPTNCHIFFLEVFFFSTYFSAPFFSIDHFRLNADKGFARNFQI